ncbi:GNAT family N-acetyltransferase [Leifsonia sp. NPDC102414]|uniref:GNAT family N-acetyltransferase n=1 Tax=Leifsonia sp. NPDC102414 TaxID=3364124 RepID=UPI003816543C
MTAESTREPIVLTGSRVVLSVPGAADIDRVTELCAEPAIARWTTVPSPYVRENAETFVLDIVPAAWTSGASRTWAIRESEDGELIGMIGLDGIRDGEAEIGFWLAPEARGRGLMTAAVALAIDHAFAPEPSGLGLERLVWRAFVGNAASASVARRAGFRFEGTRRAGGVQRGVRLDDWQAALLPSDPREQADDWPDATYVQADA